MSTYYESLDEKSQLYYDRKLKAYEFFVCGHVHDVFNHQIDKNNNFYFVKSKVL